MSVLLLLAIIWVVVLVPPVVRARAARRDAFLVSFSPPPAAAETLPTPSPSVTVQRRRRIAGGLLVAMVATLLAGLLPTFRILLVVHLFLVDSFLAYIALLAHMAGRAARNRTAESRPEVRSTRPVRGWERREVVPVVASELGTIAPLA